MVGDGFRTWRKLASALWPWLRRSHGADLLPWRLCRFRSCRPSRPRRIPHGAWPVFNTARSRTLALLLWGLIGAAPEGIPPTMRWEYRTGWSVLWIATALQIPGLARGGIRLRLQAAICLALVVFGLGGATVFQSLPGFRLFRLPARMFLITPLPMALLVGAGTQRLFQALAGSRSVVDHETHAHPGLGGRDHLQRVPHLIFRTGFRPLTS